MRFLDARRGDKSAPDETYGPTSAATQAPLPKAVWRAALAAYAEPRHVAALACASRGFRDLCDGDATWRALFRRDLGAPELVAGGVSLGIFPRRASCA